MGYSLMYYDEVFAVFRDAREQGLEELRRQNAHLASNSRPRRSRNFLQGSLDSLDLPLGSHLNDESSDEEYKPTGGRKRRYNVTSRTNNMPPKKVIKRSSKNADSDLEDDQVPPGKHRSISDPGISTFITLRVNSEAGIRFLANLTTTHDPAAAPAQTDDVEMDEAPRGPGSFELQDTEATSLDNTSGRLLRNRKIPNQSQAGIGTDPCVECQKKSRRKCSLTRDGKTPCSSCARLRIDCEPAPAKDSNDKDDKVEGIKSGLSDSKQMPEAFSGLLSVTTTALAPIPARTAPLVPMRYQAYETSSINPIVANSPRSGMPCSSEQSAIRSNSPTNYGLNTPNISALAQTSHRLNAMSLTSPTTDATRNSKSLSQGPLAGDKTRVQDNRGFCPPVMSFHQKLSNPTHSQATVTSPRTNPQPLSGYTSAAPSNKAQRSNSPDSLDIGQVVTITTSFAHPLAFHVSRSQPNYTCPFCADFRFGIYGHGSVTCEALTFDDGNTFEELGSGHRADGHLPTRMCVDCTLRRLYIMRCDVHALKRNGEVKDEKRQWDYEDQVCDYNMYPRLTEGAYPSCLICALPAFYNCVADKRLDKYNRPIGDKGRGKGCGLTLCDQCYEIVNLDGRMEERRVERNLKRAGKEARADLLFLWRGGVLEKADQKLRATLKARKAKAEGA